MARIRRAGSNIAYHELLGLRVRVVSSIDPGVENIEGIIVGETMKTIVIRAGDREIVTFKKGTRYRFIIPESGEEVEIDGDRLFGRPEDRVRRIMRR